jgi:threonine aldolase
MIRLQRRTFLQTAGAAGLLLPFTSRAETQAAPPPFPPVDERSVWLIGDTLPPDPARSAARLAELVARHDKARDTYLQGGAVAALEARFASLLGKEDCAFLPTGTLANQVAVRLLAGDTPRVLVQQESHLYRDEYDAAQLLSGLHLVPLAPGRATPTLDDVTRAVEEAEKGPHALKTGAISLENPVRRAGGEMLDPAELARIAAYARSKNIRLHLDGARLLLAPPSFDRADCTSLFDTVYVSLYKYLDAPFGAVLAGSKTDIARARGLRARFGGALYQGWMPAVLALGALDDFEERMQRAHAAGQLLFARLAASGKAKLVPRPNRSNIYTLSLQPPLAEGLFDRMRSAGVRLLKPENGTVDVYINTTLLRRPVDEYVKLFLG